MVAVPPDADVLAEVPEEDGLLLLQPAATTAAIANTERETRD